MAPQWRWIFWASCKCPPHSSFCYIKESGEFTQVHCSVECFASTLVKKTCLMNSEFECGKVAVPEEEAGGSRRERRVIRFRSIVPSSTVGLKRAIGLSSSISHLAYFSTNVDDHPFHGAPQKPIEGIPHQESNCWSTPWSQLCPVFRAESNAIRVETSQIISSRMANKPIE
jgi:hypothetical protein